MNNEENRILEFDADRVRGRFFDSLEKSIFSILMFFLFLVLVRADRSRESYNALRPRNHCEV